MAISKIKTRHASEGRSIAAVLRERLDYDENPEKTKGGLLVSAYQCQPDTAWQEFTVSKQIYTSNTGRKRTPEKDVISYLIIQSFRPGEVTPEEANRLGYQLALEFTGGQHQFIVATHVDRHHIHSHIEFNSTALDCAHKFNNYKNSFQTIRAINDKLCREHGLSVIEKPKEKGQHYAEWASKRRGISWKEHLGQTIDRVLPTAGSYDDFLAAMRREGYEINISRNALSFRLAGEGQQRFTRAKTLGADYEKDALLRRMGENTPATHTGELYQPPFLLNLTNRTLEKNGERVKLTQIEYAIVKLFMENSGKALAREEILDAVWGKGYFGELKIVDVNVRRLRLKIEDDAQEPKYISTVWGFGYKWTV